MNLQNAAKAKQLILQSSRCSQTDAQTSRRLLGRLGAVWVHFAPGRSSAGLQSASIHLRMWWHHTGSPAAAAAPAAPGWLLCRGSASASALHLHQRRRDSLFSITTIKQWNGEVNSNGKAFCPEESKPVTAAASLAFGSSGFTICCSDLTGRYRICPSWLTAICPQMGEEEAICLTRNQTLVLFGVVHPQHAPHLLLLQEGSVMLVLDDLTIWHLRGHNSSRTSVIVKSSQDAAGSGNTDLYVAAIRHYHIFMRGQVWHSFLRDDVLHLTRTKAIQNSNQDWMLISDVQHLQVLIQSDLTKHLTSQMTHTSVTWLSPVISCWTVCPSMVVICWMYARSSWHGRAQPQL